MKKLLLFFLLLPLLGFCQGKLDKSEIVELNKNLSAEEIYKQTLLFINSNTDFFFQRNSKDDNINATIERLYVPTQPVIYEDYGKKIVCRSTQFIPGDYIGLHNLFIEYQITFNFKDDRVKIDLSDFNYTHWNFSTRPPEQQQIWGWGDEGDCSSKGSLDQLERCNHYEKKIQKKLTEITVNAEDILSKLKNAVLEFSSTQTEEDW